MSLWQILSRIFRPKVWAQLDEANAIVGDFEERQVIRRKRLRSSIREYENAMKVTRKLCEEK